MKKIICLLTVLTLCALCGCDLLSANSGAGTQGGSAVDEKALVTEAAAQEISYACAQCKGDCTFFTGRFSCPALQAQDDAAVQINTLIREEYDKYLAMAQSVSADSVGPVYGFTFDFFENDELVVLRTKTAAVMLHSGGSYSYSVYYYDINDKEVADASRLCESVGLDAQIIASYVRLQLAQQNTYSFDQIAMVDASAIDVFPLSDGKYFVKCKTDMVKFEAELEPADLNAAAEEIQAERTSFAEELASREALAAELASEVASEEAEESRLAAEEASLEAENGYYGW